MNVLRRASLFREVSPVGEQKLPVEVEAGDRIKSVRLCGLLCRGKSDQRPDEADPRLHFGKQGEPGVEPLCVLQRVPVARRRGEW